MSSLINVNKEFYIINNQQMLYIPDRISIGDYYRKSNFIINPMEEYTFNIDADDNNHQIIIRNDFDGYYINDLNFQTDIAYQLTINGETKFLLLHIQNTDIIIVFYGNDYEVV